MKVLWIIYAVLLAILLAGDPYDKALMTLVTPIFGPVIGLWTVVVSLGIVLAFMAMIYDFVVKAARRLKVIVKKSYEIHVVWQDRGAAICRTL